MIDNPFAYIGRIDCRPCKDRKWRGGPARKVGCTECGGKTYISICLICDKTYPKQCECYDWMYDCDWYWEAVKGRRKKKKSA